jgi:hypothetical protein
MGALKTVVVRRPTDLPPLLTAVLDSVVEESFCSVETIGSGSSWDIYHTFAVGRSWSIAVRAVEGDDPYVEYLIAPVATCAEALPKWREQCRASSQSLN